MPPQVARAEQPAATPDETLQASQTRAALAFERVREAAKRHRVAVDRARLITDKGGRADTGMVSEVLSAGTQLDSALRGALDCGYSVATLADVAELHPLYVESLNNEWRL